ncbi:MAG TPA: hypothetical protein VNA24_19415 [Hyalangium sp.]|jgi:hypothetical protein|nr:hypothetical protein [Hyalangium sp.]
MAISKNLSQTRPLSLPKPAPTAKPAAPKPAQTQGSVAGQAAAADKPATKPQGQLSRPSVDSFNPNAKPVNLPGAVGGGINPNTKPKPQGVPTVGINPNTPNGGIIPGGWVNPERTEKPDRVPTVGINPNTPNGGIIPGGWVNPERTEKPADRPIVGINPNTPNGGIIIPGGGWANQDLGNLEVTGPAIGGRNPHATGDINTHGKPTPPEPWTTYGEALEQNRDVIPDLNTYDLGAAFGKVFDNK